MDNHFAWWYLSNQALNVHRLTDDLITTSLHYSPKRRERFCMAEHCLQNSCFSFMAMKITALGRCTQRKAVLC